MAWRASMALLLLLGIYQFWLGVERSPSSDDALFLSVPKNWINGYGWATSYSEKIPFNPDFTGPTALLIPAALLIKLFGNPLWIAGVTGAVINLALLALCMQQVRAYWRNSGIAALYLVCGCIISKPNDFASLIGYYSGSLLFLLTALLAFNPLYSTQKKALGIGLLAAIGLHIKLLLAPAFAILGFLFLLRQYAKNTISFMQSPGLLILMLLPVLLLQGSWQLYRQQSLSTYSNEYVATHQQYADNFFRFHGSGIGQWQESSDKALYLERNTDKNLYFVEESLAEYGIKNPLLGDAPADEQHIVAWLLLISLISAIAITVMKVRKDNTAEKNWVILTFSMVILAYLVWFAVFSMAMSPGHFYFPNQWLLWISLLALSQSKFAQEKYMKLAISSALISLSILAWMKFDRMPIQKTHAIEQATNYIQQATFTAPLAGCGYSGYPRHIEYLLPTSQNFADCLDLIDDHVESYENHYRWRSPLNFNLVFSLQSPGMNVASAMVIQQCKDKTLYRNDDVFIFSCDFRELQKIDLDVLMPEIRKTHHWYRTRIKP
mgnify:FL=1